MPAGIVGGFGHRFASEAVQIFSFTLPMPVFRSSKRVFDKFPALSGPCQLGPHSRGVFLLQTQTGPGY